MLCLVLGPIVPGCTPADGEDPVLQHGDPAGRHEGAGQAICRRDLRHRVHQHGWHRCADAACGKRNQALIPVSVSEVSIGDSQIYDTLRGVPVFSIESDVLVELRPHAEQHAKH